MAESFRVGLVLLAAGASRRMGRPKQLLPVNGVPLVRQVAVTLLRAPVQPVVVVLGAQADEIAPVLADLPLQVVVNPGWGEGLGSSLSTGLKTALGLAPGLAGIIVALADQPGVTAEHCARLIATLEAGERSIVATRSGESCLPPVLFGARWFPRLLELSGDSGARPLLQAHPEETALVDLATSADLDTPGDYERYTARPDG